MIDISKLKQEFESAHKNIILENDLILYNDVHLRILISKHIVIKLDTKEIIDPITYTKNCQIKECGLSNFDKEKIELSKEYIKTLAFFNKHNSELLASINDISIYDKHFLNLLEFKYLIKKYKIPNNSNIFFCANWNKVIEIVKTNLNNYSHYNSISDLDNLPHIIQNNCLFDISGKFSNHTIDSTIKSLIFIYNSIIKLETNKNIYTIKIFPLYLTTLTFQIIDLLKSYFSKAYLVKPKFTFPITFHLVLIHKNKPYNPKHILTINDDYMSINNKPLSPLYTNFFNNLVNKVNDGMYIHFSLKTLKNKDPDSYNLFISQIQHYKYFYSLHKGLTI